MAKVGFEHHGQWTSESARKMLSARGGRATAKINRLNDFARLKEIAKFGRITRSRQAATRKLAKLEADWVRLFGEPLFEHLLRKYTKEAH